MFLESEKVFMSQTSTSQLGFFEVEGRRDYFAARLVHKDLPAGFFMVKKSSRPAIGDNMATLIVSHRSTVCLSR